MHKRKVSCLLFFVCLFFVVFGTGCGTVPAVSIGTVSLDLHTKVKPSGALTQRINISGNGLIGNMLVSDNTTRELRQEGYSVSTNRSGDAVFLEASKDFPNAQLMTLPNLGTNRSTFDFKNAVFNIKDYFVVKDYYYTITLLGAPGSALDNLNALNIPNGQLGIAMLRSIFNLSWTLELPGNIIETNADQHDDNSATWHFDMESLMRERTILVRSRYINWGAIATIVGMISVTVVASVLINRKRKTAQRPPALV